MRVKFIGYGVLRNEKGENFACNEYGEIMSLENGDLYKASKEMKMIIFLKLKNFEIKSLVLSGVFLMFNGLENS